MLNSPVLETIISLVLVILIFSVLVSCVQEGYVTLTKSRGKMLQLSINDVLNDAFNKNFAYLFYQHPQIDLLKRKQGELPSYIDGATFARTLIDLIARESTETVYEESADKKTLLKKEQFKKSAFERSSLLQPTGELLANGLTITSTTNPLNVDQTTRFLLGADTLEHSDLKKLLLSFSGNNNTLTTETLQQQIENWYNNYMDRVTGWYKRKIRKNIFFAAALVTIAFNLNFITLSKTLYADSKLRSTLVVMADSLAKESNPIESLKAKFKEQDEKGIDIDAIIGTELPIGWDMDSVKEKEGIQKVLAVIKNALIKDTWQTLFGWTLFILCLSLGAPFWFDILKKLVNVRNAGISPTKPQAK